MGHGSEMKCKKCGFMFRAFTGAGLDFPFVYDETVQKAKDGELGVEIQKFFDEHPDGAINADYVTLCCDECGELFTGQDLTMYVPKMKKPPALKHGKWSVAFPYEERDYVTEYDLELRYS